MKKIFIALCAFAAVIGCQKAEMEMPQENEGVKVPLKITASIAQTKTTMTNDAGVLKSAWKDGDKFFVQQCSSELCDNYDPIECSVSVSDGVTEITIASDQGVDASLTSSKLYAMYPDCLGGNRVNNKSFAMLTEQIQQAPDDLGHVENADILVALPTSPADWTASPVAVELQFMHMLSVLELDLKASAAGVNISKIFVDVTGGDATDYLVVTNGSFNLQNTAGGTITKTSGVNSMTLNLASAVELPVEEYAKFYMTITPGHAGKTFTVKVVTDMGETLEVGSMKVPAEGSIPQGAKAIKSFTVTPLAKDEIDYASAIDLSSNGTANTYVVNRANQLYKFKATVKGNGALPTSLSDSGCETTISPKTALVLWYAPLSEANAWTDRKPVAIESVELKDDGYVYFSTPSEFVDGNVVIAVFAEEGLTYSNITADASTRALTNATILWSWDLWCVKDYSPENEKTTVGNYTVMNRNLGALINGLDIDVSVANDCYRASYAVGNHYQMGRKDPMPSHFGYNSYVTTLVQHWTPNFTPITALQQANGVMYNGGTGFVNHFDNSTKTTLFGAIDCAEKLPYLFMSGTTGVPFTYSWYPTVSGKYSQDMWGDTTTDAGDEIKTMYDPCPPGWMVWTSDAVDALWDYCSELDSEVRGNGVYVGTDLCFPFSSARTAQSGDMGGWLSIYTKWGNTGAGNIGGSVFISILTSTHKVYSASQPFMHSANLQVASVNGQMPTVTFNKYSYRSDNSFHHQRAARPVRCMKE